MNAMPGDMPHTFEPDPSDTRALRDAFSAFATGVTVVTCASEEGPICMTVNSFSSLSLDPPLIMWAAEKSSRRYPHFSRAPHYVVHVLTSAQEDLCHACARDAHALRDVPFGLNPEGVPLLPECLAQFHCVPQTTHDAGDHVICVARVLRVSARKGDALTFFAGKFGKLAHQ